MPVTARFLADFASFYDAVTKAEVSLRSFEQGAGKVETSLNRVSNSLSGTKLIQDANIMTEAVTRVGGASTLTANEQAKVNAKLTEAIAKYRALGQDVPPGMQALADQTMRVGTATTTAITAAFNWKGALLSIAGALGVSFSVAGVVAFGRELLRTGDELVNTSRRLSITTDDVQRLQYIAGQSGTPFEALVGAVQNLQLRLGSGDTGATGALKALHVGMTTFMAMGAYEQFLTLATGIGSVEDPIRRVRLAEELFGKSWKEIMPAVLEDVQQLGDEAPIMSERAVRGLDDLGNALSRLWGNIVAGTGNWVAFTREVSLGDRGLAAMQNGIDALNEKLPPVHGKVGSLGEQFGVAGLAAGALTMSEAELKRVTEELTKPVEDNITAADTYTASVTRLSEQLSGAALAGQVKQLTEAYELLTPVQREDAAAMARVSDAAADLALKGAHLDPVLFGLALMSDKLAISLANDLAPILRNLPNTVNVANDAFMRMTAVLANLDAQIAKGQGQINMLNGETISGQERKIALLQTERDAMIAAAAAELSKAEGSYEAQQKYNEIVGQATLIYEQSHTALMNGWTAVTTATGASTAAVNQYTAAVNNAAQAGFDLEKRVEWFGGTLANARMLWAFYDQAMFDYTLNAHSGIAPPGGWPIPTMPSVPRPMAEGGVITKPTLALLGERGPEAVIPLGRGTGGMVTNITINGSVLGNKDEIARVVADALAARLRASGMRLPSGA